MCICHHITLTDHCVTTLHLLITMSPHYTYWSLCHHITLTDHCVTTLHLQITMSPHYTYRSLCHHITLTDHYVTTLHLQITMSPHYTYWSLCHHITLTDHYVTTLHLQITMSPHYTYWSSSGHHAGLRVTNMVFNTGSQRCWHVHLCQQVFRKHTDSSHSNGKLTKHIEVAALGLKMWQFINCFLQSCMLLILVFT